MADDQDLDRIMKAFSPEQRAEYDRRLAERDVANNFTTSFSDTAQALGKSTPVRYTLSTLGRVLNVLNTGLRATTLAARPLVTSLNPDLESTYNRLGSDVTFGDLVEDVIPGKHWYKGPLKFGADVLGDPLTYVGVGELTAGGKALEAAASVAKSGETIARDSELASKIKEFYKAPKATGYHERSLITQAERGIAPSLAEQANRGERALIQFAGQPLIKGAPVLKAFEDVRNMVRESKYGKAYNTLFNAKSSNPEFEALRQNFINLVKYRKGQAIAAAGAVDHQLNELALGLGYTRDEMDRLVTDVVEKPTRTRRILKKVVTRIPGVEEATQVKQQLVNTLRHIGETKAADFWDKQSVFNKQLQDVVKESRIPNSPVARLMKNTPVLDNIGEHLAPLKRMVQDVNYFNSLSAAKVNFAKEFRFSDLNEKELLNPLIYDTKNWDVNMKSKYLRQVYKDLGPTALSGDIVDRVKALVTDDLATHKASNADIQKDLIIPKVKPKLTTKAQTDIGVDLQLPSGKTSLGLPIPKDPNQSLFDYYMELGDSESDDFEQILDQTLGFELDPEGFGLNDPQKLKGFKAQGFFKKYSQDVGLETTKSTSMKYGQNQFKLENLGVKPEVLDASGLTAYYQSHYFKPSYYVDELGRPKAIADLTERALDRQGLGTGAVYRSLRKGQLADILKQNRGDFYDKVSDLINKGLIDNRDIMPGKAVQNLINTKTLYNEQEVLIKAHGIGPYDDATHEYLPADAKIVRGEGSRKVYAVIPRGTFEKEISETKKLIYDTKQLLPVMHGTGIEHLDSILKSGILPAETTGAGTQARDIAAGLPNTVFASAPTTGFGNVKIVLPIDILNKATALPGDGLYLPANKMITQHLLSRGQDGIVDLLLRTHALMDWNAFQSMKNQLNQVAHLTTQHVAPLNIFAEGLKSKHITPDIHLTGAISPDKFEGLVSAGLNNAPTPTTNLPISPSMFAKHLIESGIPVEKMQLIQVNGRYYTRFFDGKGIPLVDQELAGVPNLAQIISKKNLHGVSLDTEKQAAAVEKFLAAANIPEGESVFTYTRKLYTKLFQKGIETLDTPEFNAILDNYGLLSDESANAVAANILNIREGIYGKGMSANDLIQAPQGNEAFTRIIINKDNFEKSIQAIPNINSMTQEERSKFVRQMFRMVKAHEGGHNVFTAGLRILDSDLQNEFSAAAIKLGQLQFPKVGKGRLGQADIGKVIQAFSNGGEDKAIEELMGIAAAKKAKQIPIDHEFMKATVRKIVAHVDELFAESHSLYMHNPQALRKWWPEASTFMHKIYSRKGWKTQWVVENTQIPRPLALKHPEIFDIAQQIRRSYDEIYDQEIKAGVKAAKGTWDIGYTRHVISRPVREFLQTRVFRGARVWTDEHQAQIMRKFRNVVPDRVKDAIQNKILTPEQAKPLLKKKGLESLEALVKDGSISKENANSLVHYLTVDEVNALSRQGKLKILDGQKFDTFFDPNPAIQVKVRGIEGARARTGAEFFEASKEFGQFTKTAPQGFKHVNAKPLAGWAFPEEIADHIDKAYDTMKLPLGTHPMLDAFDNAQDIWKAWTLAIFPAYHTRNAIGNFWNNFLAGVVDPRYYSTSAAIMRGKAAKVTTGYGQDYTGKEIIDLMDRHGIWKIGQYGGDVEKLFERELDKASLLAKARDNSILRAGRGVGTNIEHNSYMAHFIYKLEQGYSPAAAAQSVKKYLFDYGDLTDFEKNVMKRVFPFYTWTRKNIPLQFEALMTQPGKPLGVLKAKMAFESPADGVPDERYLPDWMVSNFPIRVRKDDKTGNFEYFLLGSWLPLADIDKIFRPDRLAMNMLTPFLKEPFQQVANRDFFFNKDIDKGNEYERLVGVNMPKRLSHLLKNVRVLSEADKLTRTDLSSAAKVTGLFTGKLYPLDVKQERKYKAREFMDKEAETTTMLKRAKKKKDYGEVRRVLELKKKLNQEKADFREGN